MGNYNGAAGGSYVWHWPAGPFIGWGTISDQGAMPWERMWNDRERVAGEVGTWLRSLDEAPALCWRDVPTSAMTAAAAGALARLLRQLRRGEGVRLLRSREYRGAGPHPRPCAGYRSLRAAAKSLGISRRAAARLADFDGFSGSPVVPNLTILTDSTIPPVVGPE